MKKHFLYVVIIAVTTLMSCTKQDSNPTSGGDIGDQSQSYFPLSAGSWWEYSSTVQGLPSTVRNEIEGQTVINGKTYFVMNTTGSSVKSNYRIEQNKLYFIGKNGFGFDENTEFMMNDFGANVGDSLVFVGTNQQGIPSKAVFVIKAKGITKTFKGVTYKDVIAYDNYSYFSFLVNDWTLYSTFTSYYAKGVGYIGGEYGASGTYELSSYSIK